MKASLRAYLRSGGSCKLVAELPADTPKTREFNGSLLCLRRARHLKINWLSSPSFLPQARCSCSGAVIGNSGGLYMSKQWMAAVSILFVIASSASAQEVKVGIILPYTGVGAENGQQLDRGMEQYLNSTPTR
jgi:hypothetical protein